MTFKFIQIKGSADFGSFGAQDGGGGDASGGGEAAYEQDHSGGERDVDSATEKKKAGSSDEKKGDLMSSVTGAAGLFGGGGSLCGCANKDKEAENAKKQELAQKYPTRDCGSNPTAECKSYNERQQSNRDKEFETWQKMKDAETANNMAPSDQARFAFVAALAKKLKAQHPEAGSMTLAQIYKTYPDDFDKAYAELQGQFPFLKNVDAATALAMNPGISSLTLDQLIAKTDAISGGRAPASVGTATNSAGIGIAAAAAAAGLGFWLFTRRK